jgi:hypothetical protein
MLQIKVVYNKDTFMYFLHSKNFLYSEILVDFQWNYMLALCELVFVMEL